MARFMVQASYNSEAVANLIKNPQDRAAAIRPVIERIGGKLEAFYFALGDFDVVAIADIPDNVSAAALSMAIGAGGALSAYKTTPLLTMEEAVEAMKKAGGTGYQAPAR